MDANNNPVTYKLEDEHAQLLINKSQKLCQQTMKVSIDQAQNTAVKAHVRLDKVVKRVDRLDDDEVGKVTVMWTEREALKKTIRNYFLGTIIAVGVTTLLGFFGGGLNKGKNNMELIVKTAVKEAVKQVQIKGGN